MVDNLLTPEDAKAKADNFNQPKLDAYLKANPLNKIFEQIKIASEQGFYSISYSLGKSNDIKDFVRGFLTEVFISFKYSARIIVDSGDNVCLIIDWDN